jgi:type I restriction enzyme S subunit
VTIKDLHPGLVSEAEESITEEAVRASAARVIEAGAVLVATRVGLGKVALAGGSIAINQDIKALRPREGLLSEFLYWHMLAHAPAIERMGVGATVKGITLADLRSLPLRVPSFDEQRRTVDLLNRAVSLKRLAEQARAKARELIPALFVEMFGDPATNPKGWPTKRLRDVVRFASGGTPSKKESAFWGGSVPWVSAKDMKADPVETSEDLITEEALRRGGAKLVPTGSCLIVVRGMILAHTVPIRVNAAPVVINQDLKALVPTELVDGTCLRWLLQCLHGYLLSRVTTAAHGTRKLDLQELTELSVPLPPAELQKQFGERVAEVLSIRDVARRASDVAEHISAALMSRLFAS